MPSAFKPAWLPHFFTPDRSQKFSGLLLFSTKQLPPLAPRFPSLKPPCLIDTPAIRNPFNSMKIKDGQLA